MRRGPSSWRSKTSRISRHMVWPGRRGARKPAETWRSLNPDKAISIVQLHPQFQVVEALSMVTVLCFHGLNPFGKFPLIGVGSCHCTASGKATTTTTTTTRRSWPFEVLRHDIASKQHCYKVEQRPIGYRQSETFTT